MTTEEFRNLVESKYEEARRGRMQDAPFPMDAFQAASYHRTRADLLGWVLDMMPNDDDPLVPA